MGLDINVYTKMVMANGNEAFDDEGELKYDENWVKVYANPDFEGRELPLIDCKAYKYDVEANHDVNISMGYGRYNGWRERLAKLAGYPLTAYESHFTKAIEHRHDAGAWEVTEGPFWELICYSDCEGYIGATVCKKLLADFEQYAEAAQKLDEYFWQRYQNWHSAVRLASDGGAIAFH